MRHLPTLLFLGVIIMRKVHIVRPDLIPYPFPLEIVC